MFVELLYGFISNSLGLISDSVHMFFDCSALVLTLVATYFAVLPPNKQFHYGFHRIEVISGFINCMFLIFVASSIVLESLERLISPQQVIGDQLITISVLGLLVNVAGIFLLFDTSNPQVNNNSGNDKPKINYDEIDIIKPEDKNESLSGLFLHIIADALGSVGVIISAVCVKYYEMTIADPICSLGISMLIVGSIISLLKSTITTLDRKSVV